MHFEANNASFTSVHLYFNLRSFKINQDNYNWFERMQIQRERTNIVFVNTLLSHVQVICLILLAAFSLC